MHRVRSNPGGRAGCSEKNRPQNQGTDLRNVHTQKAIRSTSAVGNRVVLQVERSSVYENVKDRKGFKEGKTDKAFLSGWSLDLNLGAMVSHGAKRQKA